MRISDIDSRDRELLKSKLNIIVAEFKEDLILNLKTPHTY
jgi:hypothetical protein